ncbi:hypothetical protein [Peribacillus butanolivorans]|uniref:hypothetical protein n=1 Tax=Peribacillus butanolivorans TaxID=421767 RepID=UPI00365BCBE4
MPSRYRRFSVSTNLPFLHTYLQSGCRRQSKGSFDWDKSRYYQGLIGAKDGLSYVKVELINRTVELI